VRGFTSPDPPAPSPSSPQSTPAQPPHRLLRHRRRDLDERMRLPHLDPPDGPFSSPTSLNSAPTKAFAPALSFFTDGHEERDPCSGRTRGSGGSSLTAEG